MSMAQKTVVLLAVSALPFGALGCGGQPQGDPETLTRENELKDIYDMFFMYMKKHPQPPQKASDLIGNPDPTHDVGYRVLKNNEYVVVWGIDVNRKDSGQVLAYQKDAPKQGGWVLMADGNPRKMSADELQAALKK